MMRLSLRALSLQQQAFIPMSLKISAFFALGMVTFFLGGCQSRLAPTVSEPIATDPIASSEPIIADQPITGVNEPAAHREKQSVDAGHTLVPVDNSIWPDLREAMVLNHAVEQKRVQQEINWLRTNPRYLARLQPRLQKYLPFIVKRTVERNLPGELALIPIIESALDPYAFSPGGAGGPWQFLRPTAQEYGLTIDRWYDGRRDIVAATEAALDYLEALYSRLNHWPLAIAAYNAGGARVRRAVKRADSIDFFALKLPRETQYYLPKILALAALIAAPDNYSITLPEVTRAASFTTVSLPGQFDVQILSGLTGLTVAELQAWNPALKRWATAAQAPHHLIVPLQHPSDQSISLDIEKLQKSISTTLPSQRMHWKEIIVREGDSLSVIAQRNNTNVAALRVANTLKSTMIRAGTILLVPTYKTNLLPIYGQHRQAQSYTVQPGDSLWSIAKAHNVSIAALVKTNQIAPRDVLRSGREIKVPTKKSLIAPSMTDPAAVTRKIAYTARKGDSLARIAKRFGVGIEDLAKWNQLDLTKYLQSGQRLTVYVDAVDT